MYLSGIVRPAHLLPVSFCASHSKVFRIDKKKARNETDSHLSILKVGNINLHNGPNLPYHRGEHAFIGTNLLIDKFQNWIFLFNNSAPSEEGSLF